MFLVEDNDGDILLVRHALCEHSVGCELVVVTDGDKAFQVVDEVERAELSCPALVILDLNLPKRDGFEVLGRLRESPACVDVPIVILSSSDGCDDREKAKELGAISYLCKPSNLDEFLKLGAVFKAILNRPCMA